MSTSSRRFGVAQPTNQPTVESAAFSAVFWLLLSVLCFFFLRWTLASLNKGSLGILIAGIFLTIAAVILSASFWELRSTYLQAREDKDAK